MNRMEWMKREWNKMDEKHKWNERNQWHEWNEGNECDEPDFISNQTTES